MMLCMMAVPLSLSPLPLLISPWSGAWSAHLSHLSARQPTLPHITRLLITQTGITPSPDDLSQQEAAPAKLTLLRRNSPREEGIAASVLHVTNVGEDRGVEEPSF